ncbi:PAS domain S-box protein [Halogranum gelatinilyticum]|nr:PAS domain S-box protein [Halogranum gelatinilyticum]
MMPSNAQNIPSIVAQAAADVLGLEFGLVRRYDPDGDRLIPAGASDAVHEKMVARPVYDSDEGMPGKAFQRGEPVEYEGDEPQLPDGDPAARIVPLGDHGTLTVGTADRQRLTETDRLLISLLATSATAAFDRAARIEQLETYRAIHENVKERIYVLDKHGRIRMTTDSLTDEVGYSSDEVIGRPVTDFLPDDAVETGQQLLEALENDHPDASRTLETRLLTRDGGEIPVEIEISLLPDDGDYAESVGVVRNLTALEAERARFQSLFDRSPDAIVDTLFTEEGPVVREVNHAFEETFGVEGDRIRGEVVDDHIVPDGVDDEVTGFGPDMDEQLTDAIEVQRSTADGIGTFLFRGVTYKRTAEGARAFGVYTDITDRKADERFIKMLNRVLRHNLRNAVNIVVGNLRLLESSVDGDTETYAERALSGAERISELPEQVKHIERAYQTDATAFETADLAQLVEPAVDRARRKNPDACVTADVPDVRVRGDALLETALDELLENAVTHAGAEPTVTVSTHVADDTVTLRVSDDGPGIPQLERDVITGYTDITQLTHSRGLGLWVAYYTVTSLGGSFSFDDPATVVLELPREE